MPRVFEKLYTAAMKLAEQGSEADRERFAAAVKLGVEVRERRRRGGEIPEQMQQALHSWVEEYWIKE